MREQDSDPPGTHARGMRDSAHRRCTTHARAWSGVKRGDVSGRFRAKLFCGNFRVVFRSKPTPILVVRAHVVRRLPIDLAATVRFARRITELSGRLAQHRDLVDPALEFLRRHFEDVGHG